MSLFEPEPTRPPTTSLRSWQARWGGLEERSEADRPDAAILDLLEAMATEVHALYGQDAQPMLHKVLTAMLLDDVGHRPLHWAIPLPDRVLQVDLTVEREGGDSADPGGGLELVLEDELSPLDPASEADLRQWPVAAVRDVLSTLQERWPDTEVYERWLPLALGALAWQRLRAEHAHQRTQVLDGIPWAGQTYASTLTVREAPRREAVVLTSTRWGQRA